MGDLERATALTSEGAGTFSAVVSPDWTVWSPNGGYLASIALRAAGRMARIQRPVSLHVHFLRPPRTEERVRLRVHVIHSGQKAESLSVLMEQDERPVLSALLRTTVECAGLEHAAVRMPDVVAPLEAIDSEPLRGELDRRFPFWKNFDRRLLQPSSWEQPRALQEPHWLEWFRFRSAVDTEVFINAARSVVLIDTLCWPAAWLKHGDERFIAPSLDLTVWFHQLSASEWLLGESHAPIAGGGLINGVCRIWSEHGDLVSSGGSQLLCIPSGL